MESRLDANQPALCRELDRVYADLVQGAVGVADPASANPTEGRSPALERICWAFNLTPFERDVLLLCAGVEMEARFAEACAAAQKDARMLWPSFSLALTALPGAHWSAISRDRPLRYWRLIEIARGESLLRSALRIDERILHYLAGVGCSDERLDGLLRSAEPIPGTLPAPHAACAREAASHWMRSGSFAGSARLLLLGRRSFEQRMVAQEICRIAGLNCFIARAADIPANPADREQIARLWNREALLTGSALYIRTGSLEAPELERVAAFLEWVQVPVAMEARDGAGLESVEGLRIQVPSLGPSERKTIWEESLGEAATRMNGSLDRIADYFDFDAGSIRIAGEITRGALDGSAADVSQVAWEVCRVQARRSFQGLAQRIEPRATWDDLVLPDLQIETLRQIVANVRQRPVVNGKWGFAERYSKGLGVTALFAGASGTGKTMAAEVIAAELDLDLYQIDLSSVVSKYIGETEKNLRRIFEAAEASGAVLLFDEADALFGKRSEVRDSHDRYANLEISYLLQRMDSYCGLAILTTNMKHALDAAFIRRLRFIVQFPFPGVAERRRIWQRIFPPRTPLAALDFNRIAQLNVAGGLIRNIATHAAFLAADQGADIGMDHILQAVRVEYAKLDRPLTPAETGGWK
jgi:hypothetical protein